MFISTKDCWCRCLASADLGGVGTGQGIYEQFFGAGFALVVEYIT